MPRSARALVGLIAPRRLPPPEPPAEPITLARLTEWKRQETEAAAEYEARKAEEAAAAVLASKSTPQLLAEQLRALTAVTVDQSQPPSSSGSTIPLNGAGVLRAVISGLGSGTIYGGQP